MLSLAPYPELALISVQDLANAAITNLAAIFAAAHKDAQVNTICQAHVNFLRCSCHTVHVY